jgi:hypothetical protein
MRAVLAFAVALSLAVPAAADTGGKAEIVESKRKDIVRFLELTKFEETMRRSFEPTRTQIFQAMLRRNPRIEQDDKAWVDRIFRQAFQNGFDEYQRRVIRLYDEYYKESELEAVIEQLKTPAGQAFFEHQPALQGEVSALTFDWTRALGKQVGRQIRKELRKQKDPDAL